MQFSLSVLTTVATTLLAFTTTPVDAKTHSIKLNKLSNEETLDATKFQEYTNALANKYVNLFNKASGNPQAFGVQQILSSGGGNKQHPADIPLLLLKVKVVNMKHH